MLVFSKSLVDVIKLEIAYANNNSVLGEILECQNHVGCVFASLTKRLYDEYALTIIEDPDDYYKASLVYEGELNKPSDYVQRVYNDNVKLAAYDNAYFIIRANGEESAALCESVLIDFGLNKW